MQQRKIDVVFNIEEDYDYWDTITIAQITPEQLKQLQDSVANATLPAGTCPTSLSMNYKDNISFRIGGQCCSKMTTHYRRLEISDLFWLSDGKLACNTRRRTNTVAMMRHCAKNLAAGKCRDKFMRGTIGAVLFPQFYGKDKQK